MQKLASVSDIPEGSGLVIPQEGEDDIALFKWKGQIFALRNSCPHMGGPLGDGEIESDGCVVCPLHGWTFDIMTGLGVSHPDSRARTVPIVVVGDDIFLKDP